MNMCSRVVEWVDWFYSEDEWQWAGECEDAVRIERPAYIPLAEELVGEMREMLRWYYQRFKHVPLTRLQLRQLWRKVNAINHRQ